MLKVDRIQLDTHGEARRHNFANRLDDFDYYTDTVFRRASVCILALVQLRLSVHPSFYMGFVAHLQLET